MTIPEPTEEDKAIDLTGPYLRAVQNHGHYWTSEFVGPLIRRLAAAERDLLAAQAVVCSLAERVAKQSELLSKKAESSKEKS